MNVLITGANGFVGKNLTQRLFTIQNGRDRTRPGLSIGEVLLCTRETPPETLADYCQKADFVVHLAGVNRPFLSSKQYFLINSVHFCSSNSIV